jgi:hypothetical protein
LTNGSESKDRNSEKGDKRKRVITESEKREEIIKERKDADLIHKPSPNPSPEKKK